MGDVIENLITLVLWIVASYYLRSKRSKSEPQPSSPKPAPTQPRRAERDPLEESARRRPRYPASLDDLDEKELQFWEDRLLEYAEASGLIEDEDGWEVPWSGYRYYDLDELFELYVHRQGKPLQPPAELVLVEGPNGEQMPVLVPREPDEAELALEPNLEPYSESENTAADILSPSPEVTGQTIVIAPPQGASAASYLDLSRPTAAKAKSRRSRSGHTKIQHRRGSSHALVAGLIMSELDVFRRR